MSKYNHKCVHQVILLMMTDGDENWRHLAAKSLSRLLRGITSNNNGELYCLNCFHLYGTKKLFRKHKKYTKIMIIDMYKCLKKIKNIKIQSRRKVIKSSLYSLFRFTVYV